MKLWIIYSEDSYEGCSVPYGVAESYEKALEILGKMVVAGGYIPSHKITIEEYTLNEYKP